MYGILQVFVSKFSVCYGSGICELPVRKNEKITKSPRDEIFALSHKEFIPRNNFLLIWLIVPINGGVTKRCPRSGAPVALGADVAITNSFVVEQIPIRRAHKPGKLIPGMARSRFRVR